MKTVKHMMDEQLKDLIKESDQLKSRLDSLCILCEGKSRIFVDKEKLDQLFKQAEHIAVTVAIGFPFADRIIKIALIRHVFIRHIFYVVTNVVI